ncbi:MAG: hypothetical protein HY902_20025 [Deltaproteobacteria bacterium]|nr:hypothetical protein [Deltaproteobacteria bacterium]
MLDSADVSPQARAMLPVLSKMAQAADQLEPADFAPLRALGVTDAAITHALHVAFLFHIINRMADALQFHVGDDAAFASSAKALLGRGYNL